MTRANSTVISFIGFGEVGRRFARDLLMQDGVTIKAYDILLDDRDRGDVVKSAARDLGVEVLPSLQAACSSSIVFSAVTADQAERVATAAAAFMGPGQVYVDVNSASPATKKRAAAAVEASGAAYVEGAVMAAVAAPGIRVPILAGGAAAAATAERLNRLGMNLTAAADEHGRASAIKLCRSIMIKGMEALMVDCARASRAWGVERDVYASLGETFPSIDWAALAEAMAERVATHGVRRSAEMREAADMLDELGAAPDLARAVAAAQLRGAKAKAG